MDFNYFAKIPVYLKLLIVSIITHGWENTIVPEPQDRSWGQCHSSGVNIWCLPVQSSLYLHTPILVPLLAMGMDSEWSHELQRYHLKLKPVLRPMCPTPSKGSSWLTNEKCPEVTNLVHKWTQYSSTPLALLAPVPGFVHQAEFRIPTCRKEAYMCQAN